MLTKHHIPKPQITNLQQAVWEQLFADIAPIFLEVSSNSGTILQIAPLKCFVPVYLLMYNVSWDGWMDGWIDSLKLDLTLIKVQFS